MELWYKRYPFTIQNKVSFQLFLSPWKLDLVVNDSLIYVKCEITELSSYFILDLRIRLTNLHTKSVFV